jgi:Tfp pilus assembly protein PilE
MQIPNTKLKAFTILEMAIAMLISALLIGIIYTAYALISKSYLTFIRKNKDMEIAIQLDKLLKKDFSKAVTISEDQHTILFKTDSSQLIYEFYPDFITRTQGITDTFKLQTESMHTSFEDKPMAEVPPENRQNLLDDLELTILLQNEKIPYHYHKQYSSVNLFTQTSDAIH